MGVGAKRLNSHDHLRRLAVAITSELVTQDFVTAMIRMIRTALVGLETLSDAQVATYLNTNRGAVQRCPWMPATFTAAMIHEARTAKI